MQDQLSMWDETEACSPEAQARSLLGQLLEDSRLYRHSADYSELLKFIARFRNFAPFIAMLLDIQKPGMRYVASSFDWRQRFGRTIQHGARPLLTLWPFSPVRLVYDLADTEGDTIPDDAAFFPAKGDMDRKRIWDFAAILHRRGIAWHEIDSGDADAGEMALLWAATKEAAGEYRLTVNRSHAPPVQFVTIAHELGHLFLGHLAADVRLGITARNTLPHAQEELEAESVAYLVANRNGVTTKSQTYLSSILASDQDMPTFDLYQVMRAAGRVESILGLQKRTP